jgi:hypothetical protein
LHYSDATRESQEQAVSILENFAVDEESAKAKKAGF